MNVPSFCCMSRFAPSDGQVVHVLILCAITLAIKQQLSVILNSSPTTCQVSWKG